MAQTLRAALNANRNWLAAGFLASTSLFLFLMFVNWRNEHRGIAEQRATGLASNGFDSISMWQQKSILPSSRSARTATNYFGGTLGGVPGGISRAAVDASRLASPVDQTDRRVIRSGTLEIIAMDPLQAAEQLRNVATHLSGFVVSSKVNGSDGRMTTRNVALESVVSDPLFSIVRGEQPLRSASQALRLRSAVIS